jgi:hypothetical protein
MLTIVGFEAVGKRSSSSQKPDKAFQILAKGCRPALPSDTRSAIGAAMKALLASAVVGLVLALEPATFAQAAPARTSRISIAYLPPKNPAHQPIFESLKNARFLEKLQEFLRPFRLPRPLKVQTEGCDGDSNATYGDDEITVCYEYIDELWKNMPTQTTAAGVTPFDALVGPLFDTCLHEFAHALFDMLKLPVFGREEDAADQVSAYMILHLGKTEARRLILGTAYAYKSELEARTAPPTLKEFSDEHGTPAQRLYNLLCIAYGADAKLFGDLVAKGYLPKERADGCTDEYRQVSYAFQKLIGPHIDLVLARRVLDKSWLPGPSTQVLRRPGDTRSAQPQ